VPRWILLRHGESTANRDDVSSGWLDVPLTPLGERQARAAGEALADEQISRVICSDLLRARQTAEGVLALRGAPRPPLQLYPALRERSVGSFQGARRAQLRADGRMNTLLDWTSAPPGGESLAQLARRVIDALASLQPSPCTLVVAHGGVLRVALGLLEGQPTSEIGRRRFANARPYFRDLPADAWAGVARTLSTAGGS